MNSRQNLIVAGLILVAIVCRLLPHPPNFAPVAAIALFGGAVFTKRWMAFAIPLGIMLISDLIIGFHSLLPVIYILFALTVGIGFLLRNKIRMVNVIGASLAASILFFLGSNFAVWYGSGFYTQDLSGLLTCYTMAIPFFHNTLLGDLFYSGVLFGAWTWYRERTPELATA